MTMDVATVQALLSLLPSVLNLIGEATQMLGAMNAVPKYLKVLSAIFSQAAPAYSELTALKNLIVQMVQENREPTDDEWSALALRSDAANAAIQGTDIGGASGMATAAGVPSDKAGEFGIGEYADDVNIKPDRSA